MEVDLIFLPKNNELSSKDIKDEFNQIIRSLFSDVSSDYFNVHWTDDNQNDYDVIYYTYNIENDKILYLKLESVLSEMQSAKVLDFTVNKIIKGKHRKNYDIIISYDETSLVYCNKLMPIFGEFERRLRQILYTTLVRIFQVDWLDKSFEETLMNELKSKSSVKKNQLIENALEELTYEQLKQFLFVPYTSVNIEQVMDTQLSEDTIQNLSKEEIIKSLSICRKKNLWDNFFKNEKDLSSIPLEIDYFQKYRNKVMHNKNITYKEFIEVRKRLKRSNRSLKKAISKLESSIYYPNDIVDLIESFGNMARKIVDSFTPALRILAEVAVESVKNYQLLQDSMGTIAKTISQNFSFELPKLYFEEGNTYKNNKHHGGEN